MTYGLSVLFSAALLYLIKNSFALIRVEISRIDLLPLALMLLLFSLRSIIPDNSFDTLNYHLYLQENPFQEGIYYNFFPGRNINTFSLPLGDRMFYLFRMLLGYRMGVILNLFVLMIIYFQIKGILRTFLGSTCKMPYLIVPLLALFSIYSEQLSMVLCIYYLDLLSLPLFLELFRLLLLKNKYSFNEGIYFSLIGGILISLKVINLIFVTILIGIYIFKNRKNIGLSQLSSGFAMALFPIFIYVLHNYLATGNPVFPYYNRLFHSPFFVLENWTDIRFGPKNLIETMFWPVLIFFYPERTGDIAINSGRLSLAFSMSILYLLWSLRGKNIQADAGFKWFCFSFLLFSAFWSKFMIGYIRYALILEISSGMIITVILYKLIDQRNADMIRKAVIGLISLLILVQGMYISKIVIFSNTEWGWRYPVFRDFGTHLDNANFLLADFHSGIEDSLMEPVDIWGIVDYNSGYAELLKRSVPIVSLNAGISNPLTQNIFNQTMEAYQHKDMYTIANGNRIEAVLKSLNDWGFVFADAVIKVNPRFINSKESLYLLKIDQGNDTERDRFIVLDGDRPIYRMDLPDLNGSPLVFTCFAGLNPTAESAGSDGFNLDFYLRMDGKRNKIHTEDILPDDSFKQIRFDLDLSQVPPGESSLEITFSNNEEQNIAADRAAMINPIISAESNEENSSSK